MDRENAISVYERCLCELLEYVRVNKIPDANKTIEGVLKLNDMAHDIFQSYKDSITYQELREIQLQKQMVVLERRVFDLEEIAGRKEHVTINVTTEATIDL